MKLIVEPFYFLIWILIKIGDGVLFLLSKPKDIFPKKPKIASVHKLKKKEVLYKAPKSKIKLARNYYRKGFLYLKHVGQKTAFVISTVATVFLISVQALNKSIDFVFTKIFKLIEAFLVSLYKLVSGSLKLIFTLFKRLYAIVALPIVFLFRFNKRSLDNFLLEQKIQQKKRKEKRARNKKTRRSKLLYTFKLFFWGSSFSAVFIFLPILALIFLSDLPNPSTLSTNYIPKTSKIFDRNGVLLYEIFANQNRTEVKLDKIPKTLRQATIAIEDKDFYTHPGFDIRGIARAAVTNATTDSFQGGSTITQQLMKSALLTPEPSVTRKVKEIILAFWAERIYSKDKILEMYFNYVPYGGTAWGIQAASEVYFDKKVEDLTLSESAFLAGLPRAPSIYSPYSQNTNLWKKRQKEVLSAMVKSGYISKKQADSSSREELVFVGPNVSLKAPHFVMYIKDLLIQKYGLSEVERGGLQVKTSLDYKTQQKVQEIVRTEVENDANLNISNGASVVLNPKNGDIIAMVGSRNYYDEEHDGNVNLVTSLRQPGSTIKIVTYSLALSSGYTEATLLDDSPLTITPESGPSYTPVNYDGTFRGRLPLRLAFANSLNIPAVRLAQKLGVDNIVEQGRRLGINTWNDSSKYGVSITLGGAETTMLNLATVYGTVANSGKKIDPDPLLEVKDSSGTIIYKKSIEESQVLDPGVAFIISNILSDNRARSIEFGSNSPLNIPNHRVSVKTGTTDEKRDNWTVGFTQDYVVATWVGNNDNSPMSQALTSGITGAAPMWNKIITTLINGSPEPPVLIPENIVKKSCLGGDMFFLKGTEINVPCAPPITPSPTKPATALAR